MTSSICICTAFFLPWNFQSEFANMIHIYNPHIRSSYTESWILATEESTSFLWPIIRISKFPSQNMLIFVCTNAHSVNWSNNDYIQNLIVLCDPQTSIIYDVRTSVSCKLHHSLLEIYHFSILYFLIFPCAQGVICPFIIFISSHILQSVYSQNCADIVVNL